MANLSHWNPFRNAFQARDDLARFMGLPMSFPFEGEELSAAWSPAVDIYDDAEGITIKADVAGVEPKDVHVNIENGILTLTGERKLEKEEKKDKYTRMERFYGSFARSFSLPPMVDTSRISAEAKNGIMQIHLPKKAGTKPKEISIKVS